MILKKQYTKYRDGTFHKRIYKKQAVDACGGRINTQAKVIDAALKYGYDSPDSFTKAFTRFHGVTPASARVSSENLKYF